MERTIELISLDNDEVRIGQDVVGTVILGYTAEEGVTVEMALVQNVGTHRAGRGLAVRTSHAEPLVLTGQCT